MFTSNTTLAILKNPLRPVVTLSNYLNQSLTSFRIPFMDPNATLSAASSFDPDNSSAQLSFNWTCPAKVEAAVCARLVNGTRNQTLLIPIWLRMQSNLALSTNHTFTVTVRNPQNPHAQPASMNVSVIFDPPLKSDSLFREVQATSCE